MEQAEYFVEKMKEAKTMIEGLKAMNIIAKIVEIQKMKEFRFKAQDVVEALTNFMDEKIDEEKFKEAILKTEVDDKEAWEKVWVIFFHLDNIKNDAKDLK